MTAIQQKIAYTDPLRLMRRLREVLGGANLSSQENLDCIVRIVAAEMHSDVCSVYVKSSGQVLVLFATEGLNPLAIHYTRMRIGEGVIGDVAENARPLVLSDVKSHHNFAYRPETGEEPLHGFLGVPMSRGGRVLGVLAIQSIEKRLYGYQEVELLQTVAMIITELVASREFHQVQQLVSKEGMPWLPTQLVGLSLNAGMACGIAVFHQAFPLYSRKTSANIHREKRRLQRALAEMQSSLKVLFSRKDIEHKGDHQEIFEVYHMLAFDRGWQHRLNQEIEKGFSAETSVERVLGDLKRVIGAAEDNLWRARIADLEDISGRLVQFLIGNSQRQVASKDNEKLILVAKYMGPAELLDYEPGSVGALVLQESLQSAHVAIVARAMDIPVVAKVPSILLQVEPGDRLLVDGDKATIVVRPGGKLMSEYNAKIKASQQKGQLIQAIKDKPAITKDGVAISLSLNAGLPVDVERLDDLGACGIGLYRTEIPFMLESSLPDVKTQRVLYQEILSKAKGKPVIFRTLDIGGDKLLPYLEMPKAENPAMGWRAVRISLDRPALFRYQIKALLQAAEGHNLSLMIPMIATTDEFRRARKIIDLEIQHLQKSGGKMPSNLKIGTMLEVPSLAYELETLIPEVDFISIGTNDLIQFFFAVDRSNLVLTNLYDPISDGFLNFLSDIVIACERAKLPLQICGELASGTLEAMVLMGLGFRSLSMTAAAIGRVKLMTQGLDIGKFRAYLDRLLLQPNQNIRHACQAYAQDHGIIL